MGLVEHLLNATVGLDSSTKVANFGFLVEPSPKLEGVKMVINDLPPTAVQWVAAVFMIFGLVLACTLESRRKHPPELFAVWTLGLIASCLHNLDNMLRPGTYYTPTWIVDQKVAFPMDQGFAFWYVVLLLGVWSMRTGDAATLATARYCCSTLPVLLHSIGTSVGIMHYMVQSPFKFSAFAHMTILFEVVMGIVVGVRLLQHLRSKGVGVGSTITPSSFSSLRSNPYHPVPTQDLPEMEMPMRSSDAFRRRSKSPKL